jgi:hypothetical protein
MTIDENMQWHINAVNNADRAHQRAQAKLQREVVKFAARAAKYIERKKLLSKVRFAVPDNEKPLWHSPDALIGVTATAEGQKTKEEKAAFAALMRVIGGTRTAVEVILPVNKTYKVRLSMWPGKSIHLCVFGWRENNTLSVWKAVKKKFNVTIDVSAYEQNHVQYIERKLAATRQFVENMS